MRRALKAAFPHTLPVLFGYLFIGLAFGILLQKAGYGAGWALLSSLLVYAGAMQFLLVSFLGGGAGLLQMAAMTLLMNSRHVFYGLSFLERFGGMGRKKPYMIFSLTDETYSLLLSAKAPEGVDEKRFFFSVSLLNQCYWIAGSLLGSTAGSLLTFDSTGIDFAMTALFVVIFLDQWKASKSRLPAITGLLCAAASLLVFGPNAFILPALVLSVAVLLALRTRIERGVKGGDAS